MPDKIPFSEFTFRGSTYVLKDAVARAAIDQLNSFEYVVCTSAEDTPINITWGNVTGALLPDVDTTHKIYLVLSTNGTNDTYDEYLTIQNGNEYSWEKIGNTDVDLTGYVVKDNAVVTSSLSMGRLAGSTVGVSSTTLGQDLTASGRASYAEGIGKTGTHSIVVNGSTQPDITYGAIGAAAHAEGYQTTAYGANSHAEGNYSIASGTESHAEGSSTVASAMSAHAEGSATKAYAKSSHAEGTNSTANGENAHAEGYWTIADGDYSHTEGYKSNAIGNATHAEGNQTVATGLYSHAEGSLSKADGPGAHAEGTSTIANGNSSHTEGSSTKAFGVQAHAEGYRTQAMKQAAHAEGAATLAIGVFSHAEGYGVYSIGSHLTAEKNSTTGTVTSPLSNPIHEDQILVLDNGFYATITAISESRLSFTIDTAFDDDYSDVSFVVYAGRASGSYSHVEGQSTVASGTGSHAEGNCTTASGGTSHAEGAYTEASYNYSHAEGYYAQASNIAAHAEGNNTIASGHSSHAEGFRSTSSGTMSHAEGYQSTASGYGAHAEGYQSTASGYYAHAEGALTEASGAYSHAAGSRTIANGIYMNAIGKYNIADTPFPAWEANHQYEVGDRVVISNGGGRICNTANNDAEYDSSKWDKFPISTEEGTLFVVGNGEDDENRSNAFRTDIGGNGYFSGDVYAEYDSETGIGKKLATINDLPDVPVQDVQVNGASVLNQNGVANVPIADSNIAGVIKADSYYGAYVNANGKLQINPSELAMIPAGTNAYRPIVPSTQHAAAFYGLAKAAGDITQSQSNNSVGTYTLEAKAAIQTMLGIETGTEVVRLI